MLTVESSMRNVLPINMMGMAMGLHVRCGIEDNLWNQSRTAKMTTVQQIEQLVRISREFGREVATGKEAREICKIGVFYDTVEETLAATASRRTPRAGSRASCARRPEVDANEPSRPSSIVPGLRDHVAEHWQTLLEARLRAAGRPCASVPPMGREDLDCAARVAAIEREAQAVEGPMVVVAHSGGCIMLAHWARQTQRPVHGRAAGDAARLRDADAGRLSDDRRLARRRLAAGAARAAAVPEHRRGEPQRPARQLRARRRAGRDWGGRLVDLGEVGHLNPASGFGEWPQADEFIASCRRIDRPSSVDARSRR